MKTSEKHKHLIQRVITQHFLCQLGHCARHRLLIILGAKCQNHLCIKRELQMDTEQNAEIIRLKEFLIKSDKTAGNPSLETLSF